MFYKIVLGRFSEVINRLRIKNKKIEKYHTVGTIPKSNRKLVDTDALCV
jgi:hypothetical protein